MATRARPSPKPDSAPEPPRRLTADARIDSIIEAAARLMSEQGFGGTTRALAERLGVTQALLYRYFPTKQALIDAVLESRFGGDRSRPELAGILEQRDTPLEARLIAFYEAYRSRASAVGMRLWVRAGMDGKQVAGRYSGTLTRSVLAPVVRELRVQAGLPDFATRGFMRGERELAMMLHGALVFVNIRKHVYGMPMPENLNNFVGLYVRAWLPGALLELQRLHAPGAAPELTIRVAFSDDPASAQREALLTDKMVKASRRSPTSGT